MADISKEDLKKEVAAYLKGKDLATTSAKKVRTAIEEKLECDLTPRKKEIDEIVMSCIKEGKKKGGAKKGKKNGNKDEDDDDDDKDNEDEDEEEDDKEEEEEEEEDEEDEQKKPKRAAPAPKKGAKRKKGSSDDSEEGSDEDKSDEEYSPNKKGKGAPKAKKAAKGKKRKGSDSDSDEDWKGAAKKAKKGGGAKRGGGGGKFTKTCTLTPELAAVVGSDQMARHEVVKKVWSIIKEKNLYDPKNKQYAICDDNLMKVIGLKRFRTFGMMKYLKKHFVD